MLERQEMHDDDAGPILAFRDPKHRSCEISVSKCGVFVRCKGLTGFGAFAFYPPDRIGRIFRSPISAPLVDVAVAHFEAMRTGKPGPGIGEELAIYDRARRAVAA